MGEPVWNSVVRGLPWLNNPCDKNIGSTSRYLQSSITTTTKTRNVFKPLLFFSCSEHISPQLACGPTSYHHLLYSIFQRITTCASQINIQSAHLIQILFL